MRLPFPPSSASPSSSQEEAGLEQNSTNADSKEQELQELDSNNQNALDDFLGEANHKRQELLADMDEDEDDDGGPPIPTHDFTGTPEDIALAADFFKGWVHVSLSLFLQDYSGSEHIILLANTQTRGSEGQERCRK